MKSNHKASTCCFSLYFVRFWKVLARLGPVVSTRLGSSRPGSARPVFFRLGPARDHLGTFGVGVCGCVSFVMEPSSCLKKWGLPPTSSLAMHDVREKRTQNIVIDDGVFVCITPVVTVMCTCVCIRVFLNVSGVTIPLHLHTLAKCKHKTIGANACS